MNKNIFGKTNRHISVLGLGCWGLGGQAYGPVSDKDSVATIQKALEKGVNFFDTADIYGFGHSEELLGQTLQNKKDVFIATKCGHDFYNGPVRKHFDAQYLDFAVDKSLKRLKRETLDLLQMHNPSVEEIKRGDFFETLEKLKKTGKIQFYGISIFDPAEGLAALEEAPGLASIQCVINLLDLRCVKELIPAAQKKNVAVIAREPLACGLLGGRITPATSFSKDDHRAGWPRNFIEQELGKAEKIRAILEIDADKLPQAALEFVLSLPGIATVIPGAKTPAQLNANLKAAQESLLPSEKIKQILSLYI